MVPFIAHHNFSLLPSWWW